MKSLTPENIRSVWNPEKALMQYIGEDSYVIPLSNLSPDAYWKMRKRFILKELGKCDIQKS